MKKVKEKIEVFLTKEWKKKVKNKASDAGISMAEVIKRSLELYLK